MATVGANEGGERIGRNRSRKRLRETVGGPAFVVCLCCHGCGECRDRPTAERLRRDDDVALWIQGFGHKLWTQDASHTTPLRRQNIGGCRSDLVGRFLTGPLSNQGGVRNRPQRSAYTRLCYLGRATVAFSWERGCYYPGGLPMSVGVSPLPVSRYRRCGSSVDTPADLRRARSCPGRKTDGRPAHHRQTSNSSSGPRKDAPFCFSTRSSLP